VTDARFPERWLNDRRLVRLPAEAFRFFMFSLAWSVANQTDGRVYEDDLFFIPGGDGGWPDRLVKADLWTRVADYWQIVPFEDTQTSKSDLQVLANARRRKRDQMRRKRAAETGTVPGDVPGHSSSDSTRPGQARTGKGQAPKRSEVEAAGKSGNKKEVQAASPESDRVAVGEDHGVPPVTVAEGGPPSCVGCDRPARRGCDTCWDHASLEAGW
jgi:hypothetical protein